MHNAKLMLCLTAIEMAGNASAYCSEGRLLKVHYKLLTNPYTCDSRCRDGSVKTGLRWRSRASPRHGSACGTTRLHHHPPSTGRVQRVNTLWVQVVLMYGPGYAR